MSGDSVERLIVLGASNVVRGLPALVSSMRRSEGNAEFLVAAGLGRSYGVSSRFSYRILPGILTGGLWAAVSERAPMRTRAVVADVGNDLLYGFPPEQVLAWVEDAVGRLESVADDIVIVGLPLHSIDSLSETRFRLFRSLLVPSCTLSLSDLAVSARTVHEGLMTMARKRKHRFFELRAGWYGIDPIHIRPRYWRAAWSEIAGLPVSQPLSLVETMRLRLLRPERRILFSREQITEQTGSGIGGVKVFLF